MSSSLSSGGDRRPSRSRWLSATATLATSILIALPGALGAPAPDSSQNVLVLVADDLGTDMLFFYGEGAPGPPTPHIDSLAQQGVFFRNCWSNTMCSPTRATLQTGRYSFRTGIGMIVTDNGPDLSLDERILPEILTSLPTPYACAAIGKWHLGNTTGGYPLHPNLSGYSHFVGTGSSLVAPWNYYHWPKNVNGVVNPCTTYVTTDNVDEALAWIAQAPEPWFCFLAFSAPHDPFHEPPTALHTRWLPPVDPRTNPRPFYEAMIEAMDTEIGRLLSGIGPAVANTNIIFLGDNGTPRDVCLPPFLPDRAKLTIYEGGVNVPLIFKGPAIPHQGEECEALVNTTDLFATILELAGADLANLRIPRDSVSLTPYLADPTTPSQREWVYTEIFNPNGFGPVLNGRSAIRDARYKLIRTVGGVKPDEFYDLELDPFERVNLLGAGQPPLQGEVKMAHFLLKRQLIGMPWGIGTLLP